MIELDIPADIKYLESVSSLLQTLLNRLDQTKDETINHFALKLAVHETCTNIIEHAYHNRPGRIKIKVSLYYTLKRVEVDLFDQGDPTTTSTTGQINFDEPKTKGYGLFLINQLVDQVTYGRELGVNRWTLTKML